MKWNSIKITPLILYVLLGLGITGCVSTSKTSSLQEPADGTFSMQVIGQMERVTILPIGHAYRARIDTGATTSSMCALDIERFERDGESWVRFRLPLPSDTSKKEIGRSEVLEYPITREAHIKRHGAEDQVRPTVQLRVTLGTFEGRIEFTLTDRSKYEFPMLVGRNLLEGHALVDVSKSYVAEKK